MQFIPKTSMLPSKLDHQMTQFYDFPSNFVTIYLKIERTYQQNESRPNEILFWLIHQSI